MLNDEEIYAILSLFKDTEHAYAHTYLARALKAKGVRRYNGIVQDAINESLLYVDKITINRAVMMLSLNPFAEDAWWEMFGE